MIQGCVLATLDRVTLDEPNQFLVCFRLFFILFFLRKGPEFPTNILPKDPRHITLVPTTIDSCDISASQKTHVSFVVSLLIPVPCLFPPELLDPSLHLLTCFLLWVDGYFALLNFYKNLLLHYWTKKFIIKINDTSRSALPLNSISIHSITLLYWIMVTLYV